MDKLCKDYEDIILLGDINAEVEEKKMSKFMSVCYLRELVKQKTCFKNLENPYFTSFQRSFENDRIFETGI